MTFLFSDYFFNCKQYNDLHDELERMWKEAPMACFKVPHQAACKNLEEPQKKCPDLLSPSENGTCN
jgi:hypothetical protein